VIGCWIFLEGNVKEIEIENLLKLNVGGPVRLFGKIQSLSHRRHITNVGLMHDWYGGNMLNQYEISLKIDVKKIENIIAVDTSYNSVRYSGEADLLTMLNSEIWRRQGEVSASNKMYNAHKLNNQIINYAIIISVIILLLYLLIN